MSWNMQSSSSSSSSDIWMGNFFPLLLLLHLTGFRTFPELQMRHEQTLGQVGHKKREENVFIV